MISNCEVKSSPFRKNVGETGPLPRPGALASARRTGGPYALSERSWAEVPKLPDDGHHELPGATLTPSSDLTVTQKSARMP